MRKGIKEKDIRNFEKACKKLDDIMQRIHEYQPDALLYVAGESATTFNLTVGMDDCESMGERCESAVTSVPVAYSDCGGW